MNALLNKLLFMVLFLLCFSWQAQAQTHWERNFKGGKEFWLLYAEDGAWKADHYLQKNQDLQDRLEQHEFATQMEAEKFLSPRLKKFTILNDLGLRNQNQVGRTFPDVDRRLWNVTEQWTEQWEVAFESWYFQQFHPGFFVQYNIPTDCADAAYAARWIFARQNGLSASAQLAGSNELITQDTVRPSWSNLPSHENWWEDQLFITALNYVTDNTFTHTLNIDTYPVEITPAFVVPGTIFLQISARSGHTRMLYRFGPGIQISMLYSTVPRAVRALGTEAFRPSVAPPVGEGGLVKFRWPYLEGNQWRLTPASAMRGYSLEQHQPTFVGQGEYFYHAVQRRIFGSLVDRDLEDLRAGIEALKAQFEARVSIVRDGYEFCRQNDCSPGSPGHEDWSTPNRDGRIRESIQQLYSLMAATVDSRLRELWTATSGSYSLEVVPGGSLRWEALIALMLSQNASSDPRVSVDSRWGIQIMEDFKLESEHPYANGLQKFWILRVPQGQNIQLFFDLFDLEQRYDFVTITDSQNRQTRYTGSQADGVLTTPILGGGLILISFKTDESITRQGFRLQRIDLLP